VSAPECTFPGPPIAPGDLRRQLAFQSRVNVLLVGRVRPAGQGVLSREEMEAMSWYYQAGGTPESFAEIILERDAKRAKASV
jgi:hypothetical protein